MVPKVTDMDTYGRIYTERDAEGNTIYIPTLKRAEIFSSGLTKKFSLNRGDVLPCGLGFVKDWGYQGKALRAITVMPIDVRVIEAAMEALSHMADHAVSDPYIYNKARWVPEAKAKLTGIYNLRLDDSGWPFQTQSNIVGPEWGSFEEFIEDFSMGRRAFILTNLILLGLYGGVHLSAWQFGFPSHAEQLIWKIACFYIIMALPMTYGLSRSYYFLFVGDDKRPPPYAPFFESLTRALLYLNFFLFCVARICIVVIAFVILRRVPIGVYVMPAWLQAIPHA
jgi:hypothetical protein